MRLFLPQLAKFVTLIALFALPFQVGAQNITDPRPSAQSSSGATSVTDVSQIGAPEFLSNSTPKFPPDRQFDRNIKQDERDAKRSARDTKQDVRIRKPIVPGEFEKFVEKSLGIKLHRFGASLVVDGEQTFAPPGNTVVPPDYILGPGDEVLLRMTGSVEGNLSLTIDRSGQINVPRVGQVTLTDIRYNQLPDYLRLQIGRYFKKFDLSVNLGQLRGVRVYVTGFAASPGSYTVGSLSTLVNAVIAAGGPSSSGSFRRIELRRANRLISTFDFYDLLLRGDKSHDMALQNEDVIYISPVGSEVAIYGSINAQAIFESAPRETVTDLIGFAGGLNAVADRTRLTVEQLSNRTNTRVEELAMAVASSRLLEGGDIYRIFSLVDAALPLEKQSKVVHIEGEVNRVGTYVVAPGTTLQAAIQAAGGLTSNAFVYGAEFMRESAKQAQQANYERALRDFELRLTEAAISTNTSSSDAPAQQSRQLANTGVLLEKLRAIKPTGRIVFNSDLDAKKLPDIAIEDGDRLYIPPTPHTVGVYGSVFNEGTYLHVDGSKVATYVALAGGARKGADKGSSFVVRANGSVKSSQQSSVDEEEIYPGDTVFVPEEMDKTTFMQSLKDIGTVLYQFGMGAAAIKIMRL